MQINTLLLLATGIAAGANSTNFTPFGSEGGEFNSSVFLAEHPLECAGSNAITQFKLVRENSDGQATGNMRYEYSCNRITPLSAPTAKSTDWNDEGNGNTVYLDRHYVACGPSEVISSFRLVRRLESEVPAGEFRYDYSCIDIGSENRTIHETEFNDDGGGRSIYLERHNISCPDGKALNSFGLVRNEMQTQYKYVYTCAEIPVKKGAPNLLDQIRGGKQLKKVETQVREVAVDPLERSLAKNVAKANILHLAQESDDDEGDWLHEGGKAPPNTAKSSYVVETPAKGAPGLAFLMPTEKDQAKLGKRYGRISEDELTALENGLPEAESKLLLNKAKGVLDAQAYTTELAKLKEAAATVVPETKPLYNVERVGSLDLPSDPEKAFAKLRHGYETDEDEESDYEDQEG